MIALIVALFSAVPALAGSEATFTLPSGVTVKIVEAAFEKKLFKVAGCTESSKICLINGHVPMGAAFAVPRTYVKSISVAYQGQTYFLDVADMYNAWGQRPLEEKGVVRYFGGKCFDKNNCQFRGLFSDAAGTFVAAWQIHGGSAFRTVLSDSGDIIHLFMQDIDPPEFD